MKRILIAGVILAGCAQPEPITGPDLPYVRDYRAKGDACFLVGESPDTVEYLDDAADLVACPTDYEGRGVFVVDTGAVEVDTVGAYTLYSVPRR